MLFPSWIDLMKITACSDTSLTKHIKVLVRWWLVYMASRRNMHYSPLPAQEQDDVQGEDLRFAYNPRALNRIPWKSIALALFLLLLGSLLLFLSFFILTGHMEGDQSQAYGLLVLGILAFLPGKYNFFCSVFGFDFVSQYVCLLANK